MRDPFLVLNVPMDADDAAIHSAYLNALKSCPPERDVKRFEAIRAAYESIRDKRSRLAYMLLNENIPNRLDLLDKAAPIQTTTVTRPTVKMFMALLNGDN
jgi:curved DNA-binding protein CbpA